MPTKEEALEVLSNLDPADYVEVLNDFWKLEWKERRSEIIKDFNAYMYYADWLMQFYGEFLHDARAYKENSRNHEDHISFSHLQVLLKEFKDSESEVFKHANEALKKNLDREEQSIEDTTD